MTAQIPDSIIIDGEPWFLLATPLDAFLANVEMSVRFVAPHTANWRGYTATWEIDADGVLFLLDVSASVQDSDGIRDLSGSEAIGGTSLPMPATFFSGQLRVASGDQVRHVHAGFESVWEHEELLDFAAGRLVGRRELAAASAMGSVGPYQLHQNLLGDVGGGAFGQVITATDLDGAPLIAKVPVRTGGDQSRTEIWRNTTHGRLPVHIPALALRRTDEHGLVLQQADAPATQAVLRNEAAILERDAGHLLPFSYGMWLHEPSGLDVLVMERLEGRRPEHPDDIVAVLEALAGAVERGTFDAHGDVKSEHIFIGDARVRMCDPAPRFDDADLRGFTPMYNPRGESGPAADVAACATMLRYMVGTAVAGWWWCAAVLDAPSPPSWAASHHAALEELRRDLDNASPPPPSFSIPPLPGRRAGFGEAPKPPSPASPVSPAPLAMDVEVDVELANLVAKAKKMRDVLQWIGELRQLGPGTFLRSLTDELISEVDGIRQNLAENDARPPDSSGAAKPPPPPQSPPRPPPPQRPHQQG